MASDKDTPQTDLAALAAEACDIWQEHLAAYANDPAAKAELMRILEPQRRMLAGLFDAKAFDEWQAMVQTNRHATRSTSTADADTPRAANADSAAASGPATAGTASDDGALRMAQLAYREAQLEKRVAELEQRLARLESGSLATPRRAPRAGTGRGTKH